MHFPYMGTKKFLARTIASEASCSRDGPFLELFAGTASVSSHVGQKRTVWLNDAQKFSATLCRFKFTSQQPRRFPETARGEFLKGLAKRLRPVQRSHQGFLNNEAAALKTTDGAARLTSLYAGDEFQKLLGDLPPKKWPFSHNYSGSYFSVAQSLMIDAIRAEVSRAFGSAIDTQDWMVAALGRALLKCANAPGHFAQPLEIADRSFSRLRRQWRQDVFDLWLGLLAEAKPVGTRQNRRDNLVFNRDANGLLAALNKGQILPAVVYADPPYTSDQYSRYYHILETLALGDHPTVEGKGRYRPDRFVSEFSLKSQAGKALNELVERTSALGSILILSYPSNGLLDGSKEAISEMIDNHFGAPPEILEFAHEHSTLGASKGPVTNKVIERLFIARA